MNSAPSDDLDVGDEVRGGRILRVTHVITALGTGGAERQLEQLASESRHDVRVVSLYEGGLVEEALADRGIPVEVLGMTHKAMVVPRLAKLLRRHRPDVVHVHLLSGQLWGIPAARLARVPVVVSTEHSLMATTIEGRPKTERLRRIYRVLERMTTHTVAVSQETAQRLVEWGVPAGPRLSVINPPIDFDRFVHPPAARSEVRAEWNIAADAIVTASVARLEPIKRLDQLMRALAPTLDAGHHLVLIGEGSLREDLTRLRDELGVGDFVHLLGSRPDVPRLLSAVDVVVSASRDETFGMAVVEALAAGVPVVYAEAPALDGMGLPTDRARMISRDTDLVTERADLAVAVADLSTAGHGAAPAALITAYSARGTAQRMDDLYERLTASRR